jgi:ribonuclease P protein component
MTSIAPSFQKRERMVSRKLIDTLFGACPAKQGLESRGSQSMAAYPLRAVYIKKVRARDDAPVQVLVSVPKKHFKHAVDRNRIKRQVREAFRQHKQLLYEALAEQEQLLLAFIWLSDEHYPSQHVESRVVSLMQRVAEKL